jgi:glutathione S-transferase
MTAKAIGVDLELKHVNLLKGEHLTPEFELLTPTKMVPVIVDGE